MNFCVDLRFVFWRFIFSLKELPCRAKKLDFCRFTDLGFKIMDFQVVFFPAVGHGIWVDFWFGALEIYVLSTGILRAILTWVLKAWIGYIFSYISFLVMLFYYYICCDLFGFRFVFPFSRDSLVFHRLVGFPTTWGVGIGIFIDLV